MGGKKKLGKFFKKLGAGRSPGRSPRGSRASSPLVDPSLIPPQASVGVQGPTTQVTMPRLGRYTEKYELNGPSENRNRDSYGSFSGHRQEDSDLILGTDQTEDTQSLDQGLMMAPTPADDKGCYFRDGKRKIDFMLVYEEDKDATKQLTSIRTDKKAHRFDLWRQKFMASLRKAGLDMEEELVEAAQRNIHFVKLSAPWPVLVHYAEELSLRAPLQAHPNPSSNWSDRIIRTLRIPNIMREDVPNKPLDYYTCPFRKSKLDKFLGSDNQEEYFTTTQRIRVVHEILQGASFGKRRRAEIGIARLIEETVYTAAFPLHDGSHQRPNYYVAPDSLNRRQVLYEHWARWGKWYKYQPLDHIRDYFGEKIGIYFAWLGFYTGWLLPAAVVGLVVFLYGVFTMGEDQISTEVCGSGKQYRMCPACDLKYGCDYWYLSETCVYTKLSHLVDHPGTVFYAIFVSFWAVTFLEYWKRKSVSLAHHWDCMDFEEEEETPRPDFAAKAPSVERNPITGIKEPSFPSRVRAQRMVVGGCTIALMMSLVIIFILAVIIYRVLISIPLFRSQTFKGGASFIASTSGAVVNLIFILVLGKVYEKLALRLTQWEMHRTQTEFENHLTFKIFMFQFVNFYSSIFYIAFFKGRFAGYPGRYSHLLGLRNEEFLWGSNTPLQSFHLLQSAIAPGINKHCSSSGCLMDLAQQLAVIMIGIQIMSNIKEVLLPKIKSWMHRKRTKYTSSVLLNRWEEDYQLVEDEGLFQEYLEMVLQFGFITIFVAAFPLAPLFALLNNWVEIRLDAQKFICETRRIVAERAQNIGIWFSILDLLAHLAVVSNAFLIAFTSEFLPKLLYQYEYDWDLKGYVNFTLSWSPDNTTLSQECRYRDFRDKNGSYTLFYWRLLAVRLGFVILFEHVVFSVCRLIDVLVPDIPKTLELKIKRERYLAKQALADSDTIMKVAQRREDEDEEEEEMAGESSLQHAGEP